jgi:arsenite transporter
MWLALLLLIVVNNFFKLAVATVISLLGFESGVTLATVVGVLVDVPVMLSLIKLHVTVMKLKIEP